MDKEKRFDVTTVGSTMLRLSVAPGERLETAGAYQVHTAGTESNTMAALSRMGLRCAWMSQLGANALGRRITRDIQAHGVDVSRVRWVEGQRNETFFVEYGARPRKIQVLYDRKDAAVAGMRFEDIDKAFLFDTCIFHGTGIFPALSENCRDVLQRSMQQAGEAGIVTSFDVNYRKGLWPESQAAATLTPLMEMADLLFMTREDAVDLFGLDGSPEGIVKAAYRRYQPRICVVTLGDEGGIAFDGERMYRSRAFEVDVIDRLGAGDCFTAGFLCGYLEGDIQGGMDYASAMAALKLGIRGDYFTSDRQEVRTLIRSDGGREVGR
jgi:2-dehydro-3-deoxygluconokinase